MGRSLEPVLKPLGFDWKIGVGLVSSIFQREMFVSTMSTIYNVQDEDESRTISLRDQMKRDRDPVTGRPVFSPLTGLSLIVFYVFAMQCLSTVAVMRRETNGWRWPLFQIAYMTALAYSASFVVYRIGLAMGMS
jgi:ferrous iron transport protein B